MPVVKQDAEELLVAVVRAVLETDHCYPTFQRSVKRDGKDIFIFPCCIYYVTGTDSIQTMKKQRDRTKIIRYEVRAGTKGETVGIDMNIRTALEATGRLVAVQGVFDDASLDITGRARLRTRDLFGGTFRRFRTVEIRA